MAPFLLQNVTWHRNCVGSNAFLESQVYWAQGEEQAQQLVPWWQQPEANVPAQKSSWPLLPVLLLLPWMRLQARKSSVVFKPASSCCFSLPALSVGRRTLGHSWEAFLMVSCRAGRLSWQVVCQLCCGDLCCSLLQRYDGTLGFSWHSMLATTDRCMNRFWSTRLG